MNRKGLVVYAWLFIMLFPASAQAQYIFSNLDTEKGLSSNQVSCLLQDHDGFLWIGTSNGLNRFDGSDLIRFMNVPGNDASLSDNYIYCLFQDKSGMIWIGTRSGELNSFDPKTQRITVYRHDPAKTSSIRDGFSKVIFEDKKGNLFVGISFLGMDQFNPVLKSFSHLHPSTQLKGLNERAAGSLLCYALDPGSDDIVWIGTLQGIFSYHSRKQRWKHYPVTRQEAGNKDQFNNREEGVRAMLFDNTGKLWFGTWGGGLCCMDTSSGKYKSYKYESLLPDDPARNHITCLARKSDHEFWFGSADKGVGVFDIRSLRFTFLTDPETGKTPVASPSSLLTDRSGFLYISSLSGGLYLTNTLFHQFTKQTLPFSPSAFGVDETPGKIWIASYGKPGKLYAYSKNKGILSHNSYIPFDFRNNNHFIGIISLDKHLFLIENHDLYVLGNDQQIQRYIKCNPRKYNFFQNIRHEFMCSAADRDGNIWIGSKFHGLLQMNTRKVTSTPFYFPDSARNSIFFNEFIFTLVTDRSGNTWYGSTDLGYFNTQTNKFVNFSYPGNILGSTIKIKKIMAIAEADNGDIWVGTESSGIARLKISHDTAVVIKQFSTANGLASNNIRSLLTDDHHHLWVITSNGLSRISDRDSTIENFGTESGLVALNNLFEDKDGEMIIASNNGFYHFFPENIKPQEKQAIPYLKSFRIFDQPVPLRHDNGTYEKIYLAYDQNFFSIEFGEICFATSDRNTISYQLEGLDQGWHRSDEGSSVSYANLTGGDYIFRLRNDQGKEASVSIHIQTPFWKTWWFYMLLLTSGIGIAWALHYYRVSQLRKQSRMKSEFDQKIHQLENQALRAQMNPHFLFNSLNSIRYYILKEDHESASDYITKFSRLLRLILRHTRQSLVTLKDELYALQIYIEFEQMRFSNKFDFILHINEDIDQESIRIQPLTIQPFVENAIWHGLMKSKTSGRLLVEVALHHGILKIIVEDNGVGRKKAKELQANQPLEKESFGLRILEERMTLVRNESGKKHEFRIEDLYDDHGNATGTRVIIEYEI